VGKSENVMYIQNEQLGQNVKGFLSSTRSNKSSYREKRILASKNSHLWVSQRH